MTHLDDETAAAFASGLLPEMERDRLSQHTAECPECRQTVTEFNDIARALASWRHAPPDLVQAATRSITQRMRLHRLLYRLFADPTLRRQAAQNPEGLLSSHGVTPSPQLVAAFKELDVSRMEKFSGALDERITKLFQLLE